MSNNTNVSNYTDTSSTDALWGFIYAKRIVLLIVVVVALIASTIISFLIIPQFRSTAIIFPESGANVSFSEARNVKFGAADFGVEEQVEQLIQILESSELKERMISKFDLYKVYGIDKKGIYKKFKIDKVFYNRFKFERTPYGSVQIDVLDANPGLSKLMADEVLNLIDTVKTKILKERLAQTFAVNLRKKQMNEMQKTVLMERMDSLTNLGVINMISRAQISRSLVLATGATKLYLENQQKVNDQLGSKFDALFEEYTTLLDKIEIFEPSFDQAESDMNTNITHKFVVQRGDVPDKKDSPKKLIIILLSTFGALVFGIFVLLVINKYKQITAKA